MPIWIPLTIAAAFLQNLRSTLQKRLTGEMSAIAATYVRFAYGLPVGVIYVWALKHFGGMALPSPNTIFLVFCIVGAITQILGTVFLVALFAHRNFAVGTTYSKTESVQAAIFGFIVLGDHLSLSGIAAILISFAGVVLISMARSAVPALQFWRSLIDRPALMGIGSGSMFGIAAVSYRAASLSLDYPNVYMAAGYTLLAVLLIQTVAMGLWLALHRPEDFKASLSTWRVSGIVGIAGSLASMGWFTAMTIENAAYVRALGQIELVFTFASSYFLFRERTRPLELAGIALILGGILLLLFAR
jgi:drug/metabolite transporter (DMT)-like permease